MTDHYSRLWLKDLFKAFSPKARREFERTTGISPEEDPPWWLLLGGLVTLDRNETARKQYEREDKIRRENYEFLTKLKQAEAEALRYSISEAANIIREGHKEDAEKLGKILASINEGCKQLQAGDGSGQSEQGKYLPALISYMDCWRKHPASEKFPAGRPGPSQCVSTMPESGGIHYRCLVAFSSQNPKGFARLKYQILHTELLRQGDCPKPYSRSITRRIPGLSWLLVRPDICPLADGGEYALKNGEFVRVSD